MKRNYAEFVKEINAYVANNPHSVEKCTKLPVDSIIFPLFDEDSFGAFAHIVMPLVLTAEAPNGHHYPHDHYHIVARVLGGKVLFDTKTKGDHRVKRAESYAWDKKKVLDLIEKGLTRSLDVDTDEGKANVDALIATIPDDYERMLLWKMFYKGPRGNLLLAMEPASNRYCIRVDEKILAVFPTILDSWQRYSLDDEGCAEVTELVLGDRLIVTYNDDGTVSVYRCEGDIYDITYGEGHTA